jgi:hypothetical protein
MSFAVETASLSNLTISQPLLIQDVETLMFAGDVLILGKDKNEIEEKLNH